MVGRTTVYSPRHPALGLARPGSVSQAGRFNPQGGTLSGENRWHPIGRKHLDPYGENLWLPYERTVTTKPEETAIECDQACAVDNGRGVFPGERNKALQDAHALDTALI